MVRPLLHAGDHGRAIRSLQSGLHKALGARAENLANGWYGAKTIRDVERFKREHHILADGTLFGATGWHALEPYLGIVANVGLVGTTVVLTPEELVRKRIVAEGLWLYAHAGLFRYAQVRPYPVPPNLRDPRWHDRWDCSSTVTACYHAGGAPDPNGVAYNGSGNTWMLVARGVWVPEPQPGDLCFYGPSRTDPRHVTLCVYPGVVVSFGHTPPGRYAVRYRDDYLGAKRYAVLKP